MSIYRLDALCSMVCNAGARLLGIAYANLRGAH